MIQITNTKQTQPKHTTNHQKPKLLTYEAQILTQIPTQTRRHDTNTADVKNTGHRHRYMYIQSHLTEHFISLKTILKQDTLVIDLYLLIEKAKHVVIKFNVFNPSL
jgi:hypothetical protein